jgi:hypothetical protein
LGKSIYLSSLFFLILASLFFFLPHRRMLCKIPFSLPLLHQALGRASVQAAEQAGEEARAACGPGAWRRRVRSPCAQARGTGPDQARLGWRQRRWRRGSSARPGAGEAQGGSSPGSAWEQAGRVAQGAGRLSAEASGAGGRHQVAARAVRKRPRRAGPRRVRRAAGVARSKRRQAGSTRRKARCGSSRAGTQW